jgi:moderate conductance mechanosensitive channel
MFNPIIFGVLDDKAAQDSVVLRLSLALIAALVIAYIINRLLSFILNWVANFVAEYNETDTQAERLIHTKRAETLLSVTGALLKVLVIGLSLYFMWGLANPTSAPLAIIGAGTFFVILGAATVGPLLRDVTSGVVMIAEKWYNVGDHIVVDPFKDLSGIVERVNLRSTKIRNLKGEVIWVHNQHIQGVRVTPRGVRTMALDVFVKDLEKGRKLLQGVIDTLPSGPTMIASPLVIKDEEEHGGLWRITAIGQTAPGREWLIEKFVVEAIQEADAKSKLIVHEPLVRYTDALAEQRFKHSMETVI